MHRVSIVNYTNSWPFYYGLLPLAEKKIISLSGDHPGECARKLSSGGVDLGLVPVAVLPQLINCKIASHLGIAAFGHVGSVFLFSKVPLEDIKTIFLDYQSRTSVRLLRILLKYFWKKKVDFIPAVPGYEDQINDDTAGLIIGDRAFSAINQFPYRYDLASAWASYTLWVGSESLEENFLADFNGALQQGLDQRKQIIAEKARSVGHAEMLSNYLYNSILYHIGPEEKVGLNLFLQLEKNLDG
jgi:chorismate dehydratase